MRKFPSFDELKTSAEFYEIYRLCLVNTHYMSAVKSCHVDMSWREIYIALEFLEEMFGSEVKFVSALPGIPIKKLKRCVNSFRHASTRHEAPRVVYSIHEARAIVRNIIANIPNQFDKPRVVRTRPAFAIPSFRYDDAEVGLKPVKLGQAHPSVAFSLKRAPRD
jgi:hypothetical protein